MDFMFGQEQAWANPQHDPSLNALFEQLLLEMLIYGLFKFEHSTL
jgi:hypothetical protein